MRARMWWPMVGCWCARCDEAWSRGESFGWIRTRMNLCPECANKRCPKATWHVNACSGSNEAGQPGSDYPKFIPLPPEADE